MTKILKVVGASWLQTKISSYILGILGILAILALFVGQIERSQEDGNFAATVFLSKKHGYSIQFWGQSNELSEIPRGVARAYFRMDIKTAGWSLLEVETDPSYSDEHQAYAAGVVEGALTWSLIHSHLENTIRAKCDDTPIEKQCNKFKDVLDKSVNIWKKYADEKGEEDPFWHHVSLYYKQLNGIYTGWKHGIERSMREYKSDISELYWLNYMADAVEMQRKMNISLGDGALEDLPDISSAFMRVVNAEADDGTPTKKLFVSQNAAGSYSSMTRILKRYKLNYHLMPEDTSLVPGTTVDFSSYPGTVTSQDEFYVVKGENHRMAVTGTALRNYNDELWKEVNTTDFIPIGPRVTAANHLASNVTSWAHVIARNNSGTACKQWLVVDFNKFDQLQTFPPILSKKPTKKESDMVTEITVENNERHIVRHVRHNPSNIKGLLTLIEQVPKVTHSADISQAFLEQGYWATYGLPFFKNISEITHVNKMEELYGNIFSYFESPRAMIFKQGYQNATTPDSIISLMRQNNMTEANTGNQTVKCKEAEDDFECIIRDRSYWGIVGVRGDLADVYKRAYGVIDTKVITAGTANNTLTFVAVSGPPHTEKEENATEIAINKGNVAPIYKKVLNHDMNYELDENEIRDLVKHEQEKVEEDKQELLNRNIIPAFDWSDSEFKSMTHEGLPDRWAFQQFKPKWYW